MGNPKEKLTPALACGSERNASPATAKARTTGFFTIIETRKVYSRIQETVRGGQFAFSVRVFLQRPHVAGHRNATCCQIRRAYRNGFCEKSWVTVSMAGDFLHEPHESEAGLPIERIRTSTDISGTGE
jgi:hypothetical protein